MIILSILLLRGTKCNWGLKGLSNKSTEISMLTQKAQGASTLFSTDFCPLIFYLFIFFKFQSSVLTEPYCDAENKIPSRKPSQTINCCCIHCLQAVSLSCLEPRWVFSSVHFSLIDCCNTLGVFTTDQTSGWPEGKWLISFLLSSQVLLRFPWCLLMVQCLKSMCLLDMFHRYYIYTISSAISLTDILRNRIVFISDYSLMLLLYSGRS